MVFKYSADFTSAYKKHIKNICKNTELVKRINEKTKEILENPYHYKPLRNILKNRRRVKIGSFVLIFEIDETNKLIRFHSLKHHDYSYK